MSLFTSLKDILRPRSPKTTKESWQIPFGLNGEEWNALKALQTQDGWDSYLKALDSLVKLMGDRILSTSNEDALHFLRGQVSGLKTAATFVRVHADAERRHAEEKSKAEANASKRSRDPRSALFGSPGWRPQPRRDATGAKLFDSSS